MKWKFEIDSKDNYDSLDPTKEVIKSEKSGRKWFEYAILFIDAGTPIGTVEKDGEQVKCTYTAAVFVRKIAVVKAVIQI